VAFKKLLDRSRAVTDPARGGRESFSWLPGVLKQQPKLKGKNDGHQKAQRDLCGHTAARPADNTMAHRDASLPVSNFHTRVAGGLDRFALDGSIPGQDTLPKKI
jgi:hypothetical protein